MYLNLKNYAVPVKAEVPVSSCNPYFSPWQFQIGQTEHFPNDESEAVVRSINHYIARIELFEYILHQDTDFSYSLNEPSCFMYVILKGSSTLYDQKGNVLNMVGSNSCYLTYSARGHYQKKITAGEHAMLLITFRPEWLMTKCEQLPEMASFVSHYINSKDRNLQLPVCGISKSIFKSLKRLDLHKNSLDFDKHLYIFLNNCFNNYYRNITAAQTTKAYQQQQAASIAEFIQQNYTSEIVEDTTLLAARFMVSERNLARLAKIAFSMPLHEQVIKMRMDAGLSLLTQTNKRVQEIALTIGYREPHYFSKAFKKHFGISPKSVYKNKQVNNN